MKISKDEAKASIGMLGLWHHDGVEELIEAAAGDWPWYRLLWMAVRHPVAFWSGVFRGIGAAFMQGYRASRR